MEFANANSIISRKFIKNLSTYRIAVVLMFSSCLSFAPDLPCHAQRVCEMIKNEGAPKFTFDAPSNWFYTKKFFNRDASLVNALLEATGWNRWNKHSSKLYAVNNSICMLPQHIPKSFGFRVSLKV